MWTYALRRIVQAVPLLFGIVTLTFFAIRLAPGDPLAMYYNPHVDPAVMDQVRRNLGLDQPLHVQYLMWLRSVARLDLGVSFTQHRPVADILLDAIPKTMQLAFWAIVVDLAIGIMVGTISAVRQYSLLDHSTTVGTLFFFSMPTFWLSLMLIVVFSLKLGVLPASQMSSVGVEMLGFWGRLWDRVLHMVMPVFVLGVAGAASTARYMRASLLDTIREDYVRTARAKGVSERMIIFKHAMRNALLPIVTLTGLYLPFLISGAVVVEEIFAWPGMGRTLVTAIFARDYPIVMGTMLIAPAVVVLSNLLADILYAWVDPRIRYG